MSSSWKSVVLIFILAIFSLANCYKLSFGDVVYSCGDEDTFIRNNSSSIPNYNSTMDLLSSQIRSSGFGKVHNPSYGLAQCISNVSNDCLKCYDQARIYMRQCFHTNGAIFFLDDCFLRIENYNFFDEIRPNGIGDWNFARGPVRNSEFQRSVLQALSDAVTLAPNNGNYAQTQKVNGTNETSAYAVAVCWKTINASDCEHCLQDTKIAMSNNFPRSIGRAMNVGCYMRYTDGYFLNPPYDDIAKPRGTGTKKVIVVAASAATATILIIIGAAAGAWVQKNKRRTEKIAMDVEFFLRNNDDIAPKRYKYARIKKITNSFNEKLGKGGFGSVFKGKLQDGQHVAVKILNDDSKDDGEEFMNEVASISKTSHINIVTLIGFCVEGSKRALVYEFMQNGSLEKFFCDTVSSTDNGRLGWEKLFEIAVGIARGLEYLHQGCKTRILHLDIKPHNILLDNNLCPKISDFGLAKLCPDRASIISMLGARGTIGYIAPEIFCRNFGEVSHKSDVYSYGMLVLEMVGGRKDINAGVESASDIHFPDWIYNQLEHSEGSKNILHQEAECDISKKKLTIVGLWCIQTDPNIRPSICKVLEMLEGNLESLEVPPKPTLFANPRVAREYFSTLPRRVATDYFPTFESFGDVHEKNGEIDIVPLVPSM